uniref:FCP1 homology domain-containing protein n=1 Tax=Fervidobacterium thailandense TaxID=1008305 RepID=A0A7C4CEI5_9BACT
MKLRLSTLGKTWLIDLDGTLVKHNGYLSGKDELLPGVREFFEKIPEGDTIIILTSRKEEYKEMTEKFLQDNGIRYDMIIFGLPLGERILINDEKPGGLITAHAVSVKRDGGLSELELEISEDL